MMRVFGAARDWDVFCETLAHAEASKELLARARQKRAVARRAARTLVSSAAFQNAQLRPLRWLHSDRGARMRRARSRSCASRALAQAMHAEAPEAVRGASIGATRRAPRRAHRGETPALR